MKSKKRLFILIAFSLALFLLSGCSAISANSWPGLTFDPDTETIYVAYNTAVYAIDTGNGNQKWRFPEEPNNQITFYASPTLTDDGQVIIGGYDKILYSLDAETGAQNWTFEGAANRYIGNILYANDTIYAPNADERLYALDMNGTPLWDEPFRAGQALWAAPAVDSSANTLYMTSMDRNIYAINGETGEMIWSKPLDGASVGTPALGGEDHLFIGNFANQIVALGTDDGEEFWKTPTSGWIWSGPAQHADRLYFGDLEGNFYAVNQSSGSIAWQIQPDGEVVGKPLITAEQVYFGTESGTLYAVDLRGNIVWNRDAGGALYANTVGTDDMVMVAPHQTDTLLIAYAADGNQLWTFTPEE
jgi:outer membrane protein assembly factor BamB